MGGRTVVPICVFFYICKTQNLLRRGVPVSENSCIWISFCELFTQFGYTQKAIRVFRSRPIIYCQIMVTTRKSAALFVQSFLVKFAQITVDIRGLAAQVQMRSSPGTTRKAECHNIFHF